MGGDVGAAVSRSVNTTACSFDYSPHHPHQWDAAQSIAVSQVPEAAACFQVALRYVCSALLSSALLLRLSLAQGCSICCLL